MPKDKFDKLYEKMEAPEEILDEVLDRSDLRKLEDASKKFDLAYRDLFRIVSSNSKDPKEKRLASLLKKEDKKITEIIKAVLDLVE